MKNVLVATSISPRNIEKQVESFSTWDAVGGRLITLNHADEYDTISAGVPFEVIKTEECAKEMLGKPFIFIDSFLEYFKSAPETHLMIVNSDIYLSEPDQMNEIINKVDAELLFGQRIDIDAPDSTEGDLFGGFDYFLLTKEGASLYPESDFCMGAPWWDHWMPIVPMTKGKKAILCSEPLVLHIKHESAWGTDPLAILGWHMAQHLVNLWTDLGSSFDKYDKHQPERIAFEFGVFFVKYFLARRDIYWQYHPKFEELPQALKGEVSWDMTDIFPVLTLDYIMGAAERYEAS